jgi:hypothetical protein
MTAFQEARAAAASRESKDPFSKPSAGKRARTMNRRLASSMRALLCAAFLAIVATSCPVAAVFTSSSSTAQAALLVLRMVPYVAAASCSGSGRTPHAVAWGLALAAGVRLVDAKIGSFWIKPTGGANVSGEEGYGLSCTDACATPATGGCDASGLSEVGNIKEFNLAKPEAMSCSGYSSNPWNVLPAKVEGHCFFHGPSSGALLLTAPATCGSLSPDALRLCACKCGAGSSQPQSTIARSCPRYVPIAVGGTQREPFFRAPPTLRRPFLRAAMARLEGAPCDLF